MDSLDTPQQLLSDPLSVQPVFGRDTRLSPKPPLPMTWEPEPPALGIHTEFPAAPSAARTPPPAGRAEEVIGTGRRRGESWEAACMDRAPQGTVNKPAALFPAGAQEAQT